MPEYRKTSSLLFLDGATFNARITGQQVPLNMIPATIRDNFRDRMENIEIRQSVSQLIETVDAARRSGQNSVSLAPPLQQELVALLNHELAAAERRNDPFPSSFSMPPSQVVERVYWQVGINTFVAMTDAVRTILVQLVAEIRAVTPFEGGGPSREAAEQAVDVAMYGKVRKLVISQVGPNSQGAASSGGVAAVGRSEPESRSRRWMWWIVGAAILGGAVAAVLALVLT